MKLLIMVLMFALSGCAQLTNGQAQMQPVVVKVAREHIMFTTCSGAVEDWGTCNSKAMKACPNNYIVLEKTEDANGLFRNLTFQCKK